MNFEDILQIEAVIPIDFFWVKEKKSVVSSAISYRMNNNIVKIIFWGDSDYGRTVHAMDFLIDKLWIYYLNEGYTIIDVGTSSVMGIPNDGLMRFKENHGSQSSLQFNFKWRL